MKTERLVVKDWRGPGFGPLDFVVGDGSFVWLAGGGPAVAMTVVDGLYGLWEPEPGKVFWFGDDLAVLGERGRIEVAGRASHARIEGGLLTNLRVWENVVLPVRQRGGSKDIDCLEGEVLAALKSCGRDEERAGRLLASRADELSQGEQLLAMLVRAHLCGPEILVCERVFGGMPDDELAECRLLLDWLAGEHPGLGLLVVGDEVPPDGCFGLSRWGDPEILSLEQEGIWHAS